MPISDSSQVSELEALLQQAIGHHRSGRFSEAERLYRRVLQFEPDHPGVTNYLGIVLKDQDRLDEAAAVFHRAISIAPDFAPGHSNLGNILFTQGKLQEAEVSYRRALALKPDMVDALKNLGLVIVDSGRFAESIWWFRRHATLAYGTPAGAVSARDPAPPHKAQHDREQRDYLNAGKAGGGAPDMFHLEDGERAPGRAVNADNSHGEIAARWTTRSPQIAVVDNLLTDDALQRLRQFCWRSTIWQRAHPNGYLRAMPEHGLACPLLVQIEEELRSVYPAILEDHPLLRWWAFKYDSQLGGTNVHADFAAVNVNFWITPDYANLDAESGGLVVWDVPAPLDWSFNQYNGAGPAVRDFLARSGARSIKIPHQANRAVIFDSDLFHETDRIHFKDGYLNRRINITMLFGRREASARRN
jgi:Tfp pilus assembly protein PilF